MEDIEVWKDISSNGYYTVSLFKFNKKTFTNHILVAVHFLNHKSNGFKIIIDHIDNNKLNNNVSNLQLISVRENTSKDRKNKTSKYTGVSWYKITNKWKSSIRINGKVKHLGYFENELDASNAYQSALNCL